MLTRVGEMRRHRNDHYQYYCHYYNYSVTHLNLTRGVGGRAHLDGALEAEAGVGTEGVGHKGQHVLIGLLHQGLAEGTHRAPAGKRQHTQMLPLTADC